jgi:drug/metabolite transporter (DMT)-like permease
MPLLVTVLAIPLLGERVGLHRAMAVLVGLAGVIVVLQPGAAPLSFGHAAALLGAVFSAFSSVIMRKIGRAERTVVLQLYPLLVNFVVMGALLPFVYVPVELIDLGASAVVALLALIAMACLVAAYRLAPAVIVAPMQYSQIIWASIFGALFFGESLDKMTMIGTGIIIASGLYIVLREDKRKGSSNQPVLRSRSRVGTPSAPRVASFLNRDRDEDRDDQ